MAIELTTREALGLWHETLAASVRRDGPDLSARQMAVLLTAYLGPAPHTVRGLAAGLAISKPAVVRALDRLTELGFIRRKTDALDRRSVVVERTVSGAVFLSEFADLVVGAARDAAGESIRS